MSLLTIVQVLVLLLNVNGAAAPATLLSDLWDADFST